MTDADGSKIYSIEEAAKYLKRSTRTLFRWIESGKITSTKVNGKHTFTEAILQEKMEEDEGTVPLQTEELYESLSPKMVRKFKEFIEDSLNEVEPNCIVCLDKKAASAFCLLGPVEKYPLGESTFSYFMFDKLPPSAIMNLGKPEQKYVLFDEVARGDEAFIIERKMLESKGVASENIICLALLGEKRLILEKPSYPETRICLELDEENFPRSYAQLSRVLSNSPYPPAIDKISLIGSITKTLSPEQILAKLAIHGRAGVVPTDSNSHVERYTLDRPYFFNANEALKLLQWDAKLFIVKESLCKIRLYINKEEFSATAMIFPELSFLGDKDCLAELLGDYFGSTKKAELKKLGHEGMLQILYVIYTVTSSIILLKKAQSKRIDLFQSLGLDCPKDFFKGSNKDLYSFSLGGQWVGRGIYNNLKKSLRNYNAEDEKVWADSDVAEDSIKWEQEGNTKSNEIDKDIAKDDGTDIEACRDEILIYLDSQIDNWGNRRYVPWSEIFNELLKKEYAPITISVAIDRLFDLTCIKTINYFDGQSSMCRAARRGRYGFWQKHDETTLYHRDFDIRQVLALSAKVVDLAKRSFLEKNGDTGSFTGIPRKRLVSVLVNLLEDLNKCDDEIKLFADWFPSLHTPLARIPIESKQAGGYYRLDAFSEQLHDFRDRKVSYLCNIDGDVDYDDPDSLLDISTEASNDDFFWETEYKHAFPPQQRITIESLIKSYLLLNKGWESDSDNVNSDSESSSPTVLEVLSYARNSEITYICGNKIVQLWLAQCEGSFIQTLERALHRMLSSRSSVDNLYELNQEKDLSSIRKDIEIFKELESQLKEKLDKYAEVHKLREQVEEALDSDDLAPTRELILSSIDIHPNFSPNDYHPLDALQRVADIAAMLTKMLQQIFIYDDNEKKADTYLRRLIKICHILAERAPDLERVVTRKDKYSPEDLKTLIDLMHSIIGFISVGTNSTKNRLSLPTPNKNYDQFAKRANFANFLSITQNMLLENGRAILFADIKNYSTMGAFDNESKGYDEESERRAIPDNAKTAIEDILSGMSLNGKATIACYSDSIYMTFPDADTLLAVIEEIRNETDVIASDFEVGNTFSGLSFLRFGASLYSEYNKQELYYEIKERKNKSLIAAYAACKNNNLHVGQLLVTNDLFHSLSSKNQCMFEEKRNCDFDFGLSCSKGWLFPKT